MGVVIRWILVITLQLGFWMSVVFTFFPLMVIIISAVMVTMSGTVIADLFSIVQLWLPFNLDVILVWLLALVVAFSLYWLASKVFAMLSSLVKF